MAERILICDDDPIQRRLLEEAVRRFGHLPIVVESGVEALARMTGPEGRGVALVILDLVMPDLDGMAVLLKLREAGVSVPVIVQTSHGGIDTVVSAMRAGAFDFVVKPISPERLQVSIQNALKFGALEDEVARARRTVTGTLTFEDLATSSPSMERVIRLGRRAAASNIPILVEGESGVGKELIARAIQGSSDRRARPFVTVNCGAIAENLVESILFGHEKGAFTGAVDKHVGKFQEAHGGTLFLDEVGELPPEVQVKLLRAIQEGEIDPVGSRKPVKVDFRLISATNRSLLEMTKEGRFREDLYYRLNVFPIWIPPLRDRREDIPALVKTFVARFAAEEGRRRLIGVDPQAIALLESYDWPGNIRQLENAVFRAVVLSDGPWLTADEFPQIAAQVGSAPVLPRHHRLVAIDGGAKGAGETMRDESLRPRFEADAQPAMTGWSPSAAGLTSGSGPTPFGFLRSLDSDGHVRDLAAIEEEMIKVAIDHYGGRMTEVAKRLGIGRSTLYRKLKEYGLEEGSGIEAAE